ncbi:Gfo/Idh/MocA family protein [Lacticaseibacillus yichunensis]|uniref:Gfo/Idh/MocA family protein n=1 Tax=Lacticaseibacillus yichunensis TaxID=2486015 RepID=A0ABW4CMF8_9LACO|nr:Gfo/Idh/MocA family oxidoreductase [Lacticaseibacillus yichunensis]
MKLGVIGTNWISEQFVAAATASGLYQLTAVYSRRLETAEKFIAKTAPARAYVDMGAFLAADFDVLYIASPNSLHAAQTIAGLNAGKHVICEKPMVADLGELAALEKARATHPTLLVFEAARHLYDPNFAVIKDYAQNQPISGATLSYVKYSSRYDAYLAGEQPNVFSPAFAGGALMDLGVYLIYAAVAWFGVPNAAQYLPHLLASGVDGDGVVRFAYDDFAVTMLCGKTTNSYAPSEIYSGRATLSFDSPGELNSLALIDGARQDLTQPKDDNPMADEVRVFAQVIAAGDQAFAQRQFDLATQVHTLMWQLRQQAGIHFPSDPVN